MLRLQWRRDLLRTIQSLGMHVRQFSFYSLLVAPTDTKCFKILCASSAIMRFQRIQRQRLSDLEVWLAQSR